MAFVLFPNQLFFGNTNFDCVPRTNLQLGWSLFEVAYQISPKHDLRFVEKKAICLKNLRKAKETILMGK